MCCCSVSWCASSAAEKRRIKIVQCRSVCGHSGIVFSRVGKLPQSKPDGFASSLWEGAFGIAGKFLAKVQALRTGTLPLGGAVAQRLRGYKSAEPEKTVKRSSRRTGVNLQFFPVQPTPLGLKGASSPFFVAPARRNRWHFSGSLLVPKENIPHSEPSLLQPVQHLV